MKKSNLFLILAFCMGFSPASWGQITGYETAKKTDSIPTAPKEYRRPEGYDPVKYRYKYSINELKNRYSEEIMQKGEKEYNRMLDMAAKGKWKPTFASIGRHEAPEWFQDIKFGMFIDWGPWSVAGYAVPKPSGPIYADWYEHRLDYDEATRAYHIKNWGEDFERDDLIPLFKAERYEPEKLVNTAVEAGMKYIIPFSKCHSGFCLWPSSYTHRDVGDMLGRDLTKPLADLCKQKGLKFGFYFSTVEYEYPVIDFSGNIIQRCWNYPPKRGLHHVDYNPRLETWAMGKIAVKDFLKEYLVPQAMEYIDMYDPDLLFYDGEWDDPVETLGAFEISSYFYNQAEGRKEVAVNDRYGRMYDKRLRSHLGDVYTSEYHDMKDEDRLSHVWEENRSYSQTFSFNWSDTEKTVLSPDAFVEMFIDVVSKGGNMLLITGLDAQGALPAMLEIRLKAIGKWLKVNGEGIYNTRGYSVVSEGKVHFTRSKDNRTVYAIATDWPGKQLQLTAVTPAAGSQIYMLGYKEPLKWNTKDGVTTITLPAKLQKAANRPCDYAYTFVVKK
ncbi:MAG: alpha-L-fucosidase [Bacteroidales bacterium]|nr:alpha-L-fucosidase [Bacteroidales bacterium]